MNPSKYGGIAALFVFGVGSLIVGFSLPAERHDQAVSLRWTGALVLTFGVVFVTGWFNRVLMTSIAAMICAIALLFSAARSETTGKAIYHHRFLLRGGGRSEAITRQEKPEMFREATNARWALSIFLVAVSIGSFMFYRKAEYDDFEL